jgi:hypothetical protein
MAKKEIQVEREESWILDMNTLFFIIQGNPIPEKRTLWD